jgi:hypothetical protein
MGERRAEREPALGLRLNRPRFTFSEMGELPAAYHDPWWCSHTLCRAVREDPNIVPLEVPVESGIIRLGCAPDPPPAYPAPRVASLVDADEPSGTQARPSDRCAGKYSGRGWC